MPPPPDLFVFLVFVADGPRPGRNSLLHVSAAAFRFPVETPLGTFEANLQSLPTTFADPETLLDLLEKDAWIPLTTNPRPSTEVASAFRSWVESLSEGVRPYFVLGSIPNDSETEREWIRTYFPDLPGTKIDVQTLTLLSPGFYEGGDEEGPLPDRDPFRKGVLFLRALRRFGQNGIPPTQFRDYV